MNLPLLDLKAQGGKSTDGVDIIVRGDEVEIMVLSVDPSQLLRVGEILSLLDHLHPL
jgi:hypothetical protein